MELTKYFWVFGIILMSILRILWVKYLDHQPGPVIAQFMFPIISLKFPNKILKFLVPIVTQLAINDYVFLRDSSIDKTHEAFVTLSLYTCLIFIHEITPYFGLEDKRKKAKKSLEGLDDKNTDNTHIVYHMLFASLTYLAWITVVIDTLKTEYAPLHCKH